MLLHRCRERCTGYRQPQPIRLSPFYGRDLHLSGILTKVYGNGSTTDCSTSRYVMIMPDATTAFSDADEGGIEIPATFDGLAGFERWLHDELCEKDDILSGEVLGIFSEQKDFRGLVRVPARFRRNNLSGIVFPGAEYAFSENERALIRGMILSHNHPAGFPLLYDEILLACDQSVIESRIVTTDWIYSVWPTATGWPSRETIEEVTAGLDPDISLHNRIARLHADPEWLHARNEQISRRAGFGYSREPYVAGDTGRPAGTGEKSHGKNGPEGI